MLRRQWRRTPGRPQSSASWSVSVEAAHQDPKVRLEQRFHIERLEMLEEVRPNDRQDGGRDGELRKPHQLVRSELAALDSPLGDPAQERHAAAEDLAMVDLGEMRKTSGL